MPVESETMIEPTTAFPICNGVREVSGVPLSQLAAQYGTPVYIYNGDFIEAGLRSLQAELQGAGVEIHYAMKANSHPPLLKLLAGLGVGVDLVSFGEWKLAVDAGFAPEKRIWSGLLKREAEIQQVLGSHLGGCRAIHVESLPELDLILKVAFKLGVEAPLGLRFRSGVDAQTHTKISTARSGDKFGLTESEILEAVRRIKKSKNARLCGLSQHIGSQILSLDPYRQSFKKLEKLRLKVERSTGQPLSYLDLGGGFGIRYRKERPLHAAQVVEEARKQFGSGIPLTIEPGRSLVAQAGVLLTEVVFQKKSGKDAFLILDAGMNDLIRPALYDAYHEILPIVAERQKAQKFTVVGGLCESSDVFARGRKIETAGKAGTLLGIFSVGAYGAVMASHYNAFPLAKEVLIRGD
jgi:diaminopimelate decarboxylase